VTGHRSRVTELIITDDASLLVVASGHLLRLFSLPSGENFGVCDVGSKHGRRIACAAVSPSFLAAGKTGVFFVLFVLFYSLRQ
jgi:hypothetical protein